MTVGEGKHPRDPAVWFIRSYDTVLNLLRTHRAKTHKPQSTRAHTNTGPILRRSTNRKAKGHVQDASERRDLRVQPYLSC
jgi:hypothetical protein